MCACHPSPPCAVQTQTMCGFISLAPNWVILLKPLFFCKKKNLAFKSVTLPVLQNYKCQRDLLHLQLFICVFFIIMQILFFCSCITNNMNRACHWKLGQRFYHQSHLCTKKVFFLLRLKRRKNWIHHCYMCIVIYASYQYSAVDIKMNGYLPLLVAVLKLYSSCRELPRNWSSSSFFYFELKAMFSMQIDYFKMLL